MKKEIAGQVFNFNPLKDQILKRGLLDTYSLSDKSNEWIVLEDYIFWSARLQTPIIIPRWFVTDLSSVPRGLRWLVSVNERHRLASLPHDLGYAKESGDRHTKHDWDNILKDFCKQQGVSWWKTGLIYASVSMFGGFAYKRGNRVMFAPMEHREWYRDTYPKYNLNTEAGKFLSV